jgi:hypothetical protein
MGWQQRAKASWYADAEFDRLRDLARDGDIDAQAELRARKARGESDRKPQDAFAQLAYLRAGVRRYGGPSWNQGYGEALQRLVSPVFLP